jgi:hypothetical protein
MEFGLDKWKLTTSQNINLNTQKVVWNMELDDLGIEEGEGIDK